MKATRIIFLTLFLFFGQFILAQIPGYWINPINQVPFSVTKDNNVQFPDTLIVEFNNEPTFTIDSTGAIIWNLISPNNYEQIFGHDTYFLQMPFLTYEILFDSIFTLNTWQNQDWDSIIPSSSWMVNRDDILTPGNMGTLNALDWYSMSKESAKMVLDPTVPIIEGEDMDFTTIVGDLAFDIEDYLSPSEEIQNTHDLGVYVFNKPDFKEEFEEGYIPWMIQTKPFLPDSFTFNIYHDWLYEYFHPIAISKISQIISTEEYENDTDIIHIGNNLFSVINHTESIDIELTTIDGKRLLKQSEINETLIDLSNHPKGIYILNIRFENNKNIGYKLFR